MAYPRLVGDGFDQSLSDREDLVRQLRDAASCGAVAHELMRWVVDAQADSFGLVRDYDSLLLDAFEIPLGVLRQGEEWEGFPKRVSGPMSSERFDELLQPHIEAWVRKASLADGS